jgi:hypothetical protein
MQELSDIARRHGAELDESRPAVSDAGESLSVETREQMLETALASEDSEDVAPRTAPYGSGSHIPANISTREYRPGSRTIRAIKLVDGLEFRSVVYRYEVDGFHAWLKLLKALFVGKPLDFRVEQDPIASERKAG